MATLLVLGYAYIVWLFTAHNPMPHLDTELIILIIPEAMLEIGFILGTYFLVNKIKEVINNDR